MPLTPSRATTGLRPEYTWTRYRQSMCTIGSWD
jgi:hypothetical protein